MADYDLTGKLKKEFTFDIDDNHFVFHKPTVREMRDLAKKFSAINKESDPDLQAQLSEEAMAELYARVENTNGDRSIADVLDDQQVDVQVLFNEMIQKELGVK